MQSRNSSIGFSASCPQMCRSIGGGRDTSYGGPDSSATPAPSSLKSLSVTSQQRRSRNDVTVPQSIACCSTGNPAPTEAGTQTATPAPQTERSCTHKTPYGAGDSLSGGGMKRISLERADEFRRAWTRLLRLWHKEMEFRLSRAETDAAKYYATHMKAADEADAECKKYARLLRQLDECIAEHREAGMVVEP